jgi:serine/threonine protein phosphatase PrpC
VSEPLIEWAVAAGALEEESGDLHVVRPFDRGVLVAVIDGLGHGPDAAAAASTAAETLERHAGERVITLIERCHESLRRTRGAVITLASLSASGAMSWAGVGNVEATLLRAEPRDGRRRERVMLAGGVAGHQLPAIRASEHPIRPGDTLTLATDGVRDGYLDLLAEYGRPDDVVGPILEQFGKGTDDALVLVARYLGAGA